MDKEEIKKAIKAVFNEECKECYFPKRRSCRACLNQNRRMIKKYIRQLEFNIKASKMEHNHDVAMIDEVKEETVRLYKVLNKVTEECKKQMTTYEDSILEIFPQKILNIREGE